MTDPTRQIRNEVDAWIANDLDGNDSMRRIAAILAGEGEAVDVGVIELARKFHDYYESMAPRYGYETRPETREFDQHSKNGRLMVAVVRRIKAELSIAAPTAPAVPPADVRDAERYRWLRDQGATFYTDDDKKHHVCDWAMDRDIDAAMAHAAPGAK